MNTEPIVGCGWLPRNSVVEVDGKQYRVADCGSDELKTPGRLDVYTPEGHQAALDAGRKKVTIKVVSLP